jgi:hypothetical protein
MIKPADKTRFMIRMSTWSTHIILNLRMHFFRLKSVKTNSTNRIRSKWMIFKGTRIFIIVRSEKLWKEEGSTKDSLKTEDYHTKDELSH